MGKTRRTFLLGAGFSKAVADGPTMQELWSRMGKRYEFEKSRRTSVENFRVKRFKDLDSDLQELESIAISEFKRLGDIRAPLRNNLEYLFTQIDLSLSAPKLEKDGSSLSHPSMLIPISHDKLVGMKKNLQTYLYLVLVDLNVKDLGCRFAKIARKEDNFITFNYDLILEKLLWDFGIWSPLGGYVGSSEFENDHDKTRFNNANLLSQITIHKMHGSINWEIRSKLKQSYLEDEIEILMDDIESKDFYFHNIGRILKRAAYTVGQGKEYQVYVGYHEPGWVLPSFIEPLERKEFFRIWQSALKVMSDSEELVIIGYSFRPEDFNSFLLISILPVKCKIILVDPNFEEIKERLGSKGFKIHKTFESLEEYLEDQ